MFVLSGRMHDECAPTEVFFLSVSKRKTDTVARCCYLDIIVHHLEGFCRPAAVDWKENKFIMHTNRARLNIANSDQTDALDVEILVDGETRGAEAFSTSLA